MQGMGSIRRIWRDAKKPFDRLWKWASGHPRRWHKLTRWTRGQQRRARKKHLVQRAKFWGAKKTVYRRKWKQAKKHLQQTGRAEWEDWMANGHPTTIVGAVKDELAIAVVKFGCTVTSTYRATVIPQSNPNSYHGPNVYPGKAGDVAGSGMSAYQSDVFGRRKGDGNLLELFGPQNSVCLKNGGQITLGEGTFLEDLHDSHTHVAAQ